jgi:hypothetical protein
MDARAVLDAVEKRKIPSPRRENAYILRKTITIPQTLSKVLRLTATVSAFYIFCVELRYGQCCKNLYTLRIYRVRQKNGRL